MIGIIDSGCGGINVIKECLKYYNEDFVYLIDNKNAPYGNKDKHLMENIIKENISYLINNYDLDLIIVGCNTASCFIDYKFMTSCKVPILKTTPYLTYENIKNGKNVVFATKNTLRNCNLLKYYCLTYNNIDLVEIKNLAKYIDDFLCENISENEIEKKIASRFCVFKKVKPKYKNAKNIVLGCTHFKFIKNQIKNVLGEQLRFYECEKNVGYVSKFLIRKNKKMTKITIKLTQNDKKLENYIKKVLFFND